jgi:hypothetical protein
MTMRRRETLAVAAVATLALAAALFAWLPDLARTIPDPALTGNRAFGADARLIVWILAWDVHALTTRPLGLFQANIFHPAPDMLTGSEHFLGNALLAAPLQLATGNPVLAANAVVLATYILAAVAMYACVRGVGGGKAGAAVAGAAVALGPLRVPVDLHVLQYPSWLLPALVLAAVATRRGRLLPLAIIATLAFCTSYYIAGMAALVVGVELVLAASTDGLAACRRIILASLPALTGLAVLSVPYARRIGIPNPDVGALTPLLWQFWQRRLFDPADPEIGTGWVVAALALVGLLGPLVARRWPRETEWRWILLTVVGLLIAAGPALEIAGYTVPLPYALAPPSLLRVLRGFGRFMVLAHVGIAGLAAMGTDAIVGAFAAQRRVAADVAAAVLVLAVILPRAARLGEMPRGALPVGPNVPAGHRALAHLEPGPVLDWPLGTPPFVDELAQTDTMVASAAHWRPLLNGFAAYPPRWRAVVSQQAQRLPDREALQALVDLTGLRWILLQPERTDAALRRRFEALAASAPPALAQVPVPGDDVLYRVLLTPRHEWAAALAQQAP